MPLIILFYFLQAQHVSDIVMPETCWAYKNYSKIISGIWLVFCSSIHTDFLTGHELSENLYDVYHCCVYGEKILMMDRGTVRNMQSFIPKNKFEKLVHLIGFIIRIYHDARSAERQIC